MKIHVLSASVITNSKTPGFGGSAGLLGETAIAAFLVSVIAVYAFAQADDDIVPGKVFDSGNRQIGRAELILDTGDVKTNFGYNIKLWLDGGLRLAIIRPQSGSRSSTINCSFREYKVDPKNPKDSSRWNETGSGTATLRMPATGDVQKIDV